MPPISSITISISGSSTISFQLFVSSDGSSVFWAAFSIFRTSIFFSSTLAPSFETISSCCIFNTLYTPPPTVPKPSKAALMTLSAISFFSFSATEGNITFRPFYHTKVNLWSAKCLLHWNFSEFSCQTLLFLNFLLHFHLFWYIITPRQPLYCWRGAGESRLRGDVIPFRPENLIWIMPT